MLSEIAASVLEGFAYAGKESTCQKPEVNAGMDDRRWRHLPGVVTHQEEA